MSTPLSLEAVSDTDANSMRFYGGVRGEVGQVWSLTRQLAEKIRRMRRIFCFHRAWHPKLKRPLTSSSAFGPCKSPESRLISSALAIGLYVYPIVFDLAAPPESVAQGQCDTKPSYSFSTLPPFHYSTKYTAWQWSFGKTGTMGTLVSREKIGVWVQTPGAIRWGWVRNRVAPSRCGSPRGYYPENFLRLYMQNPAI